MSNFLVGQNLVDPKWKNHGTGGGTSYTLDYNGTTGSTLLFIGGAIQVPGTDFTVSGTTLTTSTSVTAGIEVITCQMFKAGTVNVPADGTVDGDKIALASQAQGDLMYFNGTSWVRLPKGTAGQVLSQNSGLTAPEWADATSAMDIVAEGTFASGTESEIEFTDLTHGLHVLKLWGMTASASCVLRMSFSYDNGATYNSNSEHYYSIGWHKTDATLRFSSLAGASGSVNLTATGTGLTGGEWTANSELMMTMHFDRRSSGTDLPRYGITDIAYEPAGYAPIRVSGAFKHGGASLGDCDAFKIFPSTGNFVDGNYKLFGMNAA